MDHLTSSYKKLIFFLIWAVFAIYLACQFQNVKIYYDDFGLYSLTYGIDADDAHNYGNMHSLSELLPYFRQFYCNTNGRLLWFFLSLSCYVLGGHMLVQIVAALLVVTIYFVMWILLQRFNKTAAAMPCASSILICLSYGLLEISILNEGTYWMAAFFLYVAPLLPFLLFVWLYSARRDMGFTVFDKAIMSGLIFFTGWSQESWGVAIIVFTLSLLIYEYKMKSKSTWFNVLLCGIAVIAVVILVASPGIRSRALQYSDFEQLNVFQKILNTVPNIVGSFFSWRNQGLYNIFFWGTQVGLGIVIGAKDKDKKIFTFDVIYILACLLLSVAYAFLKCSPITLAVEQGGAVWFIMCVLFTLLIVAVCIQMTRFYIGEGKIYHCLTFFMLIASVGCLVLVPERPLRLFLPFLICSTWLMADIFCDRLSLIENASKRIQIMITGCAVLALVALPNMYTIFCGYARNSTVLNDNDYIYRNAAENIAAGEMEEPFILHLKKLPEDIYAGQQVYGPSGFMKQWICNYYKIPYNAEFIYTEQGQKPISFVQQVYSDHWCGPDAALNVGIGKEGRLILHLSNFPVDCQNEKLRIYVDGELKFESLFSDMGAEENLVFEGYAPGSMVEVTMKSDYFKISPPDERELSYMWNRILGE